MNAFASDRRGRPLIALVGVVLMWGAFRLAVFAPPLLRAAEGGEGPVPTLEAAALARQAMPKSPESTVQSLAAAPLRMLKAISVGWSAERTGRAVARVQLPRLAGAMSTPGPIMRPRIVEATITQQPLMVRSATASIAVEEPTQSRWSGDAWLALRQGRDAAPRPGAVLPRYGDSQAGIVLRYALSLGSVHRPTAYLRAVHALGGEREGDLAAGLAIRPLASVPLTAHAEARLTRRADGVEVRPAGFVTTGGETGIGFAGIAARSYLQAGYVGGRDATAFVDGSAILERDLLSKGRTRLAVGAGTWGGAQRGASRLDVGPSANVQFGVGRMTVRISADYRLRVAGDAEPRAGPAVSLAAGF